MSRSVFKIQTTLPFAIRDTFVEFAKAHRKRPSDICRDAIAHYLVSQGALQSAEQCAVKRGAAQALATASASERKRLKKRLLLQAELMRKRKSVHKLSHRKQADYEHDKNKG